MTNGITITMDRTSDNSKVWDVTITVRKQGGRVKEHTMQVFGSYAAAQKAATAFALGWAPLRTTKADRVAGGCNE